MFARTHRLLAKDPFKVLGLTRTATKAEVKRKYRELAMELHPDKAQGDSSKMEEVNRAYNVLLKEGGYERLHLKAPSGAAAARGTPSQPYSSASSPGRNPSSSNSGDGGAVRPPDGWSEEEYSRIAALDPDTERITPEGKYVYQNRDTGEFITLSRPLFKAKQPRYRGFAERATEDLKEQLRNINIKRDREQSNKSFMDKMQDELQEHLVARTKAGYYFTLFAYAVVIIFGSLATTRYIRRRLERNKFYQEFNQQSEAVQTMLADVREEAALTVSASALILAAAAVKKQHGDPLQPSRPYETASTTRPAKFNTIVNPT